MCIRDRARCIALSSTDGLRRGMEAVDTGEPIKVPVGKEVLGRMFNVIGDTIDEKGDVGTELRASIHRAAPPFEEQDTSAQIFETGIKVIDLIAPVSYTHLLSSWIWLSTESWLISLSLVPMWMTRPRHVWNTAGY